jgi:hypothetical protein
MAKMTVPWGWRGRWGIDVQGGGRQEVSAEIKIRLRRTGGGA